MVDETEFKRMHELRDDAAPPLHGTMVDLGGSQAYLSLPPGGTPPFAAVIVIHEWYGLNEHIEHWTDRLAADGYAALAVDLYGGKVGTDSESAMALMKSVDDGKAHAVLDAADRFLRTDPRVAATKLGVIGWCFGGGWSLQHALAHPELSAAVLYYGRITDDPAALAKLGAPVLAVFGNRDQSIPPAAVDGFAKAMAAAGKSLELYRYDAEHAFANPSGKRYDATAAADAWSHVRAFLRAHLRAGA